ncbi:hypothetical protein KAJ83_03900 [Marivibrio halodurans]|uniref:Sulfotransferase family protein n=1 Tax=Marivibrio halodurans TaxID=2039722 RepID=A0A8J7RZX7_9PROT|nr:hypothetical protein [Marivibrio halodurans]MBP5856139.1 hypothetical protein [Marivibrio halodurans]
MTTDLSPLWTAVRTQSPYDVMALHADFGPAAKMPVEALNIFLQTACVLGDLDRVLADGLDNPTVSLLPKEGAAMLLYALYESGNGALLTQGRVSIRADASRPNVLAYAACCMLQAGQAGKAAELLARLVRTQGEAPHAGHQRVMVEALFRATDGEEGTGVSALLARAGLTVAPDWLAYESFRRAPSPEMAERLPLPGEGAVRRAKHIGSTPPWGPGRIAEPRLTERKSPLAVTGFTPPTDAFSIDIGARVAAVVDAVAALKDTPKIARALDALAAIRAAHAPDAGDPVQVISTGRAGTTALSDFLEGTPYCPFHSYAWVTGPRHRWAMTRFLIEGETGAEQARPFVELFLFCRIAELAAAYRRGETPVLVSHWDSIFAPVLAGLFPRSRFLHLRRAPKAVIGSMIAKRQYAGAQIASLPYRLDPGGEGDGVAFDGRALFPELPRHVGWYLAFTEHFWRGLGTALGERAHLAIASESLFEGREEGLGPLLDAGFPGCGLGLEEARAHFGHKINEKTRSKMDETARVRDLLARAQDFYREFAGEMDARP